MVPEPEWIEYLKNTRPELWACLPGELEKKVSAALSELEALLLAMLDRGAAPRWWDPCKVVDEISWVNEEYGWEGVGR